MVAIGSLHEDLQRHTLHQSRNKPRQTSAQMVQHQRLALEHCNKAIRLLVDRGEPLSISTHRIATMAFCILFIAFEIFQDRLDAAYNHLQSGISILSSWCTLQGTSATQSEQTVVKRLAHMMERFGNSFRCQSFPVILLSTVFSDHSASSSNVLSTLPESFFGVDQASTYLHEVIDSTFTCPSEIVEERESRDDIHRPNQLKVWRTRYRRLEEDLADHKLDEKTKRHMCFLNIHYLVAKILQDVRYCGTPEMAYDDHTRTFAKIVEHCRQVIELESMNIQSKSRLVVSFDLGIIMPLYFTASRCRDHNVRHAAMTLLLNSPRREGAWLSWITGRVAQTIISLEEDGLNNHFDTCTCVPLENRIDLVEMRYEPCRIEAGTMELADCFEPKIQLIWKRCNDSTDGDVKMSKISLPKTHDTRPGERPYSVHLPRHFASAGWKLLIGRKYLDAA